MPRQIRKVPQHLEVAAIAAALDTFPPENLYGVSGAGISTKIKEGAAQPYRTLCVYVPRKTLAPQNPVPPVEFDYDGQLYRVQPDVIATGTRIEASRGGAPVFSGLHPGAALVVDATTDSVGGVCCLASTSGDTHPTHLITAGHLFGEGARQTGVWAAAPGSDAVNIGHLKHNLLDEVAPGARHPRDAAVVELTETGRKLAVQTDDARHFVRGVLSDAMLHRQRASAFRPVLFDYGIPVTTYFEPGFEHIRVGSRDRLFTVREFVRTSALTSSPGDSGTALCTYQQPRLVIGSCIGGHGRSSLFEPLEPVVRAAGQLLSAELSLWTP